MSNEQPRTRSSQCKWCRWWAWEQAQKGRTVRVSSCHKLPPMAPLGGDGNGPARWPWVPEDEWCGAYEGRFDFQKQSSNGGGR